MARLDPAEVVRQAVGERSLSTTRDLASVIDSRLRKLVDPPGLVSLATIKPKELRVTHPFPRWS